MQRFPPCARDLIVEGGAIVGALSIEGHGVGWRVSPGDRALALELLTMVDLEFDPTYDPVAFPGEAGSLFWTSDSWPPDTTVGMLVGFFNPSGAVAKTATFPVRCVR